MKNMKKFVLVAMTSLVIIAAAAAGIMTVAAIPQIPGSYWGYAILNGEPAPIGTQITVEVYETGEVVGNTTVADANGNYSPDVLIDDPDTPEDEGANDGDNLTWKINGIVCSVPAPGTDTAISGGTNDNFNIAASHPNPPAPTVLKPNGGEEIPGDSIYDIKWNVTNGTYALAANPITIYYCGSSWIQIATNESNDGRYHWAVPNLDSSDCRVKVEAKDVQGNNGSDTSDSTFTITKTTSTEKETIPAGENGTVEGPPESDTTVNVTATGNVTVAVAYYEENPHPEATEPVQMIQKYIDISVSDKDRVEWPMYVEMHYTAEEIAGLNESTLGLYYYKAGAWHRCSNTGVNVGENYVWAYVTEDECAGSPFVMGGSSPPLPVPEFNAVGLLALVGILSVVLATTILRRKE